MVTSVTWKTMEAKLRHRWLAGTSGRARRFILLAGALLLAAAGVCAQRPEQHEGVLIVAVEPESPAAVAGLARGDIILSLAGVGVNSVPELAEVLDEHAGAQVEVRFRHGDDLRSVSVALGGGEQDAWLGIIPESRDLLFWLRERLRLLRPGNLELDLSPVAGARLTLVVEAGPAAAAGLQAGDVITHLDGVPVSTAAALPERIATAVPGARIDLRVLRDGAEREATVTLGRRPGGEGAYLGVRYEPWLSFAPWQRRNRDREHRDRESPQPPWNVGDLLRI